MDTTRKINLCEVIQESKDNYIFSHKCMLAIKPLTYVLPIYDHKIQLSSKGLKKEERIFQESEMDYTVME